MCSGSSCKSIDASESGRIKYYLNDYDYEKTKMPLILCNNGSACVRAGGENGTYYLDEDSKSTTGDTYSKVIYCSSNTSNNISCTSTTISNGYVINGADKKKVIKWSGTSCNSIDASESGKIKYYLNVSTYDMSSNPLIQCKNGNDCIMIVALVGFYINDVDGLIKCDSSVLCNIIEGEKGSYYLDEGSRSTIEEVHSKIIYCKSTTSCSNEPINYGYVINGADKTKVIECSGTSYISIDASESNKAKYYLNVSTYDKTTNPLINCDNGDECITIIALAGYYINAAPDSSDSLKKAVFLCSMNINGNSECIEVETVSPDSIYINNDDGKLIQYFIDGDNSNKIIICTLNNCISNIHAKIYDSKKIIICSDENCQLGGENTEAINTYTYYIHGANIKEIIKCSESECNIQNYIYNQGHGYIDGADETKKSVIICSKNEGCVSITGNTSLSQVYIQAENDNNLLLIYCALDNYIYELSNEFSEEECKLIKSETEKKYYIDATNDKNIVNCNSVSFCKSNVSEASSSKIVRKKDGVTSFRTIICKEDGCHSEGKYYLNLIYNKDIQKYINFYIN